MNKASNIITIKGQPAAVTFEADINFDPEGLLIAQKLKQYYRGDFIFWHMTRQDYEQAMSKETISERRMKMLEKITEPRLLPAVERMREEKKAGYQEKLIGLYTD